MKSTHDDIIEAKEVYIKQSFERYKLKVIVGNPNRKKMHIFGFVGIFEYIC